MFIANGRLNAGNRITAERLFGLDTNNDGKVTDVERHNGGVIVSNNQGGIVGFEHVGLDYIDISPEARNNASDIPFVLEMDVGDYVFKDNTEPNQDIVSSIF